MSAPGSYPEYSERLTPTPPMKPANSRKSWGRLELMRVAVESEKGTPIKLIARMVARSPDAVRAVRQTVAYQAELAKHRLLADKPVFPKRPLPKPPAVKAAPVNHRELWTDADSERLTKLYRLGTPVQFMAKMLGRTSNSVLGALAKQKLIKFDKTKMAYYTVPKLYHQL